MKTIIYDINRKWYYVKEMDTPDWLSVEKYILKPNFLMNWEFIIEYDNRYFRMVKPFIFWKIKSGERKKVSDDSELVEDYLQLKKLIENE